MVHSTFQHPPTPQPDTVCTYILYSVHLIWEGGEGGGGLRECTVEGQQYTSIVPLSMGTTVHKLVRK